MISREPNGIVCLSLVAEDQLEDPQQDNGAQQTGQEAPDPATVAESHEGEEPTTDETTDDTDDDVGENAHLSVRAHDLRADPTGEAADDDPADEAESRSTGSGKNLSACLCKKLCSHESYFSANHCGKRNS